MSAGGASSRITQTVCIRLWEHFDEHYSCRGSSNVADGTCIDGPRSVLSLDDLAEGLQLSRTQVRRQWDRWRVARRQNHCERKAHEHSASLHAHRRRAFGPDDTLYNRLRSISYDARFVAETAARFPHWPLVANLRCGAWYAPPAAFESSVRFKSTDGHRGEWNLNLRRLNLHLVTLIAQKGGALLVDATRRGRALPDSFAKTVPIWCACINRAIAEEESLRRSDANWCTQLHTPPCVDASEKAAIEARLDGFVALLRSCAGCKEILAALRKPLRPLWLTPDLTPAPRERESESEREPGGRLTGYEEASTLWTMGGRHGAEELPFLPLICVSASEPIDRQRRKDYTYLQVCTRR